MRPPKINYRHRQIKRRSDKHVESKLFDSTYYMCQTTSELTIFYNDLMESTYFEVKDLIYSDIQRRIDGVIQMKLRNKREERERERRSEM